MRAEAAIYGVGAAVWSAFAVLQVVLPGHTFDPLWFAGDLALAGVCAFGALTLARR